FSRDWSSDVCSSDLFSPSSALLGDSQVVIVDALALELVKPWSAFDVLATVFPPSDVEFGLFVVAKDFGGHEWPDIQAHTIVQVGVPANWLLCQRLPAHEDIVGRLTLKNEFKAAFQILGRSQADFSSVRALTNAFFLLAYPVAQVSVNEPLEVFGIELVIIH